MAKGYVSMRNQDGTAYAAVMGGNIQWVELHSEATLISSEVFDLMCANQEETRKNDCADNGYYGVYRLQFHEVV